MPMQRGTPPRSPERQRLADAIQACASAVEQRGRVAAAERRLHDELFEALPAVEVVKEALAAAREYEPRRLVDAELDPDGPATSSSAADCQRELAEAERRVDETRRARDLLTEEARRAETAVTLAQQAVVRAVEAVVKSDPAVDALVAEFKRAADRALRLAQALRTAGHAGDAQVDGHGQRLVITYIPVASGWPSAFRDDASWSAWRVKLRSDPDAAAPGIPQPEPPDGDADNTSPAEAAA